MSGEPRTSHTFKCEKGACVEYSGKAGASRSSIEAQRVAKQPHVHHFAQTPGVNLAPALLGPAAAPPARAAAAAASAASATSMGQQWGA